MKSRSLRGSSGRGLPRGLAQALVLGMLFVPHALVAQQTQTPAQPPPPAGSAESGGGTPSRSTALEFKTNSGVTGVPSSFAVDGVQYIAVQSGWGVDAQRMQARLDTFLGTKTDVPQGGVLWVFAIRD